MKRYFEDLLAAFQFLTCIPVPLSNFDSGSLSRSAKYFPLVGLVLGAASALLQRSLLPHLNRTLCSLAVLAFLILVTGALHEDGLADTADGFGGGTSREKTLAILRDSRIGSYGAVALVLSLLGRFLLLSSRPLNHFTAYIVSANVLCRWSALPLSYLLPPAREQDGQGARIAKLTSSSSLIIGSLIALTIVVLALRRSSVAPILTTLAVVSLSGWFYYRRIGGITGDCFGATNQLSEIAVYVCGVWNA